MISRTPTTIYLYEDYVSYLDDWLVYKKQFGMTNRKFLELAGIKARAFMSDILSERKKLPSKYIEPFSDIMDLTDEEARYFKLLVQKCNSKKIDEKAYLSKKLSDIRIEKLTSILKKKNLGYFSSWKYPVVREYLVAKKRVSSPKEVVNSLVSHDLTSRDVKNILNKLVLWEMASYNEERNEWAALEKNTLFDYDELPHVVVHDTKKEMIETAMKVMATLPKDERHATMAIRSISEEKYLQFCQKIDQLRAEFLALDITAGSEDRVVALNIQAFPVMKFAKGEKQ